MTDLSSGDAFGSSSGGGSGLGVIGDIFGIGSSLAGAFGDFSASKASQEAANLFNEAATVSEQEKAIEAASGKVRQVAAERQIYQAGGQNIAAAGAGGFAESGSALNVLRETRAQGAIQEQLIGTQTGIQEEGTQLQAISAEASANAAKATSSSQSSSGIGGILGAVTKIFSFL